MIIPQNPEQLLELFNSPWFLILLIWSMFWKGIALWTASQRKQKIWFVGLFIFNTFGILEIIYLLFIAKAIIEIKLVSDEKKKPRKE